MKLAWILAVVAGAGAVACKRPSPSMPPIASVAPSSPATTKTVTRNVYDGNVKVGELTFTVKKDMVMPQGIPIIRVPVSSLVFRVTTASYMTRHVPPLSVETIPVAPGAEDDLEQLDEKAGITIGHPSFDPDRCYFLLQGSMGGGTWSDFFADPADVRHTRALSVTYYNSKTAGFPTQREFILRVREEIR